MSELIFEYNGSAIDADCDAVSKLCANDVNIYNEHLRLCGQNEISEADWREVYADNTVYYLLYEKGVPVARAAVEKTSGETWEVSDVRTAKPFRNRGFSEKICRYVISQILSENKKAAIRTESDNLPMLRVIEKLGFFSSFETNNKESSI